MIDQSPTILNHISAFTSPGDLYEPNLDDSGVSGNPLVKLIAFYLPQFHPIPENDRWWGKGFTEWTNVTKALPKFVGHYQPRLPGELGFYDLRLDTVLEQQAALAAKYGINGFCFHHYWFGGKQVLDMPIRSLLSRPNININYCINWANEPWTRQWDGNNLDVLLEQSHSAEDDLAFAQSLEPFFRDPRYIRVGGRPLLMLYRPGIKPDAQATIARWRTHFASAGLGDPYIVMPQGFGDDDPRKYGMDAAVGFPPHGGGWDATQIQRSLQTFDPANATKVVDYAELSDRMSSITPFDFKLHPGVCPNWDNDARRPGRGFCAHGSTPELYGRWLERACRTALSSGVQEEQIVFINAWNEWAEGTYLEPDRHFGYAYLCETARVLKRLSQPKLNERHKPARQIAAVSNSSISPIRRARAKLAHRLDFLARKLRGDA